MGPVPLNSEHCGLHNDAVLVFACRFKPPKEPCLVLSKELGTVSELQQSRKEFIWTSTHPLVL